MVERFVCAATTCRSFYHIYLEAEMADYHKLMLDELRSDLTEAESEQERIKLRCTQLQAAITVVEEKIKDNGIGYQPTLVADTQVDARGENIFEALSMADAIRHCLMNSPVPLSKRELMTKLREGGTAEGNHFSQSVYNTLYRLSKNGGAVHRGDDGRWSWVGKTEN